ncbi:MAG: hypothetical protein ACI808_002865, partial [Paraglaciecola sp.]
LVQACFGVARTSKIKVENHDQPDMSIPTKAKFLPQIPKITPNFYDIWPWRCMKADYPSLVVSLTIWMDAL